MRGRLFELIWNTPWLLALVILLVVIGIGVWVWQQNEEAKAGEELRKSERDRDSLWKD